MRILWLAPALILVLASCGADSRPLLTPAGSSHWTSTTIGVAVRDVVLFLEPRPGDRVELVSADAVGVAPGADVGMYVSPAVANSKGGTTIGDTLQPIAGAIVTIDRQATPGPANEVGIVVELTPRSAGTYAVTDVRLTFRLNGGAVQTSDGISEYFTVCAADPAPTTCGPTPPG